MANNMDEKIPPSSRVTVSSLLSPSPPEPKRSESFGSSTAPSFAHTSFSSVNSQSTTKGPVVHHSTPAMPPYATGLPSPNSPFQPLSQKDNINEVIEEGSRDPQLFASGGNAAPATLEPLFPEEPVSQTITRHMQSQQYNNLQTKPSREDYELTANFRSTVFEQAAQDPRAWRKQERGFEEHYGRPTGVQKRPAPRSLAPAPSSRQRQPKVALPRAAPHAPRAPKSRRTPAARAADVAEFMDSVEISPAPSSSQPAKAPKGKDEPIDFSLLPDFCPPLDTLPNNDRKCFKAEWKGNVLDMSNDPHRHLLHEAELYACSIWRLTGAKYLANKRRIFAAKVQFLREGKKFGKTHAQMGGTIDVNKSSRLWGAFEKVGWFNPEHFQQYL